MQWTPLFEQLPIHPTGIDPVPGGGINKAFRIQTPEGPFFLKIHPATPHPDLLEREAAGLNLLNTCRSLTIPQPVANGIAGPWQYLLLEWCDRGAPAQDAQARLGASIAHLHRMTSTRFGLETDNYIGDLPQINTPLATWAEFYGTCRIQPLVKILADRGHLSTRELQAANRLCTRLDTLFPEEPPGLLHGDLWSGNYMINPTGYASLFDPAVYYGHREMDIGMSRLFGGFSDAFYQGYQQVYPLQAGWDKRLRYTQLYPLAVHAILFQGPYISQVREILREFDLT